MIDDIADQTMDLLFNNEKFKKNLRRAYPYVGCFVIIQLVILLLLLFIIFRLNNNLNGSG